MHELKTFTEITLADLPMIAAQLLELSPNKNLAFTGDLGAGKTTLIESLCRVLKVTDAVSSPTYSIVNEYHTTDKQTVFHFDFYRLEHEEEAYDFGVEEYFEQDAWCFMEWPEKIRNLLPEEYVVVQLDVLPSGNRRIQLKQPTR